MSPADKPNAKFEALLELLRQTRGFDFAGYKRPSLMRRINKRMEIVNLKTYEEYADYLELHPDEFNYLFNHILINITSFFRDPPAWTFLSREVIPRTLEAAADESIRVWSAGCASGEEPYSLAMVLAEALEPEEFRQRIKIYATDVDEEALAVARQATYTAKILEAVPEDLRKKYFEPFNNRFVFRPDVRRAVNFGRHDLLQDAPISRLDLLVCRNTLMYFNAEAQTGILSRFHFALKPKGFLFLGKAELLLSHARLFVPLDMKQRVFAKVENTSHRDRILTAPRVNHEMNHQMTRQVRLRELALDSSPLARIVINDNGHLMFATQKARALFGLTGVDIGRPLQELEIYYRPAELRPLIERCYAERRKVTVNDIERRALNNVEKQYFEIEVSPLYDDAGAQLGATISYADVTRYAILQEDLQYANQELETASKELQSTNEELETMNEELQSTNEELHTVNEEMRQRTAELNNANSFLTSILSSMSAGLVVLDNDFVILAWNTKSEDLWGLRAEEVQGKSFINLDIGLPLQEIRNHVRACLTRNSDHEQMVVEAINRRGRKVQCRITIGLFIEQETKNTGAILLMEEVD